MEFMVFAGDHDVHHRHTAQTCQATHPSPCPMS
jgi:hypothetical protein